MTAVVPDNTTVQQKQRKRIGILQATGILLIANLLCKVLGFGREVLIAHSFGISTQVDGFFVALSIPDIIGSGLGSAIGMALVPRIASGIGSAKSDRITRAVMLISVGLSLAVLVAVRLFAGGLLRILGPGLSPASFASALRIAQVFSIVTASMLLYYVFGSVLQAHDKFTLTALCQVAFNVVTVLSLFLFAHLYGISALVYGWTAGVALSVALLGIFAFREIANWTGESGVPVDEIKLVYKAGALIMLVTLLPGAFQAVTRAFASGLEPGSVAALGYVQRLFSIPVDVVLSAVVLGSYPEMAQLSARGKSREVADTFSRLCRATILFSVFVCAVVLCSPNQIVEIVFQRGAFDHRATQITAQVLVAFMPALAGLSLVTLTSRAFMSRGQTAKVIVPFLIGLGTNILLGFALSPRLKLPGLAFAYSTSWTLTAVMMLWLFKHQVKEFAFGSLMSFGFKCLGVATVTTLVLKAFVPSFGGALQDLVVRTTLVGVAFFVGISIFLKDEKVLVLGLGRRLRNRLRFVKLPTTRASETP